MVNEIFCNHGNDVRVKPGPKGDWFMNRWFADHGVCLKIINLQFLSTYENEFSISYTLYTDCKDINIYNVLWNH